MVEVLLERGGGWMDRGELAREIARRDLFRRPSDGASPPSDQLRLRARRYSNLFECSDTRCSQIRLRARGKRANATAGGGSPQRSRGTSSVPQPDQQAARGPHTKGAADSEWYDELRTQYRPRRLRVLLIGESPPDPARGDRRFFYSPRLTIDNLYRAVAEALYGKRSDVDIRDKPAVLDRLCDDGFWLIDAVEQPINKLANAPRARAISDAVPSLVDRCRSLAPEHGVIICHGRVYSAAAPALRRAGVRVLHDEPLPFPLGNWRRQFVAGFRQALEAAAGGRSTAI